MKKVSILLCITTMFATLFLGTALPQDLSVLHEKTFATNPGKLLKIEAQNGSVKIETWNKNEVYVKVLGNDKAKEKLAFKFEEKDWGVYISSKRKGGFWSFNWGNSPRVRFEVMVPKSYNAKVSTAGGNIGVKNLTGNIDGKTSGGDLKLYDNVGNTNISTSGGNVTVKNNKGNTKASTSGGDISVVNFDGDLDVSTSGGDIDLKGGNARIDASTSGGDIKLDYWGESLGIDLTTSGGDIDVYLPADFSAKANLKTSGGDISCELTTNNVVKISSSRFEADLNNGGKDLICRTSGGDIEVKKK
ncbi:MAG: hypothetical protein COW85_06465 [Ignavibacteria bacterium CG22_combo_CG10-13_8_21_14_all_37_15]|nr:MAG: hypothetical protein COW85_06465 [Ignavibacteria bacterium CG22_combo_CG10-13_8_21_14_all_37_15]